MELRDVLSLERSTLGFVLSIAAAMTWALGVIIYKRLGESLHPMVLNALKNVLVLILMLPTAWLAHGSLVPELSAGQWCLVLASGALGITVADTLYFRALNEIGAGRMGIIGNLFSPCVIFLAYFLLDERLALVQMAGFVLVLAGVMLVNQGADRRQSGSARGALYGILAVALNALGIVMVKPVLSSEIAFFQIALFRVAAALVAGMFAWPWLNGRLKQLNWRSLPWGALILGAILGQYVSMLLWLGGYKFIDASVASILNETASIFILLFAWLLLGERLSSRKLLGVALTFAGVAVMMLS